MLNAGQLLLFSVVRALFCSVAAPQQKDLSMRFGLIPFGTDCKTHNILTLDYLQCCIFRVLTFLRSPFKSEKGGYNNIMLIIILNIIDKDYIVYSEYILLHVPTVITASRLVRDKHLNVLFTLEKHGGSKFLRSQICSCYSSYNFVVAIDHR
jgi:hypothetical protein